MINYLKNIQLYKIALLLVALVGATTHAMNPESINGSPELSIKRPTPRRVSPGQTRISPTRVSPIPERLSPNLAKNRDALRTSDLVRAASPKIASLSERFRQSARETRKQLFIGIVPITFYLRCNLLNIEELTLACTSGDRDARYELLKKESKFIQDLVAQNPTGEPSRENSKGMQLLHQALTEEPMNTAEIDHEFEQTEINAKTTKAKIFGYLDSLKEEESMSPEFFQNILEVTMQEIGRHKACYETTIFAYRNETAEKKLCAKLMHRLALEGIHGALSTLTEQQGSPATKLFRVIQ